MSEEMDVVLLVGSEGSAKTLKAKSSVLEKESEWFKTMLSGRWTMKKTPDGKLIIELPKDNPEDIRLFLRLLKRFTGLKLDTENDCATVVAIEELAERYQAATLQKKLANWLSVMVKRKVDPDTLIPIYNRAKDAGLVGLKKAVCEFFVKNIRKFWSTSEWLNLDEFAIELILSNNGTYHWEAFPTYRWDAVTYYGFWDHVALPAHDDFQPLPMHLVPNLPFEKARRKCESRNEVLILTKLIEWLNHQPDSASKDSQAMRLLKHVRFGRMMGGDFWKAMRQVQHILSTLVKGEIVEFKLLRRDERKESNLSFKPDDQPRSPLTPYRVCPKCQEVTTWAPHVLYRCDVVEDIEQG